MLRGVVEYLQGCGPVTTTRGDDDTAVGSDRYEIDGSVYTVHPLAAALPPMREDQYRELVDKIQRYGLPPEPVYVRGQQILAHRDLLRAAHEAGVSVRLEPVSEDFDVYRFFLSMVRDMPLLSQSQRAACGARLLRSFSSDER